MFKSDEIKAKWAPIMEAQEAPAFADSHREAVTAVLLENTERALAEERGQAQYLSEAAPTNNTGGTANWDPILISLVRRAMPNLIAYDIAGVQPMSGPTGLIFAMKSNYAVSRDGTAVGTEALFDNIKSGFTGSDATGADDAGSGTGISSTFADAGAPGDGVVDSDATAVLSGLSTAAGEALGDAAGNNFPEMSFSIEKSTVSAKTRALKAEYTMELAQDLKAVHGLDAESELANILSAEILAEINREVVTTVNTRAVLGCADTTLQGVYDLTNDNDGRWEVEKYKALIVRIHREANQIAIATRRGKGNFVIVSSDIAAILAATGMLDYASALSGNSGITNAGDVTGTTMVGTISGGIKVYLDPYAKMNYVNVGYKGTNAYDAGLFYCPYVPLTMVRAVAEDSFQPKIGFKTRYGMASNPFVGATAANGLAAAKSNQYYRIFRVDNILA